MASPLSLMDYEDEPTIYLPSLILEYMIDLHKRLLTAIPKNRRSYWTEKVDEFHLLYFTNKKPKEDSISKAADEVIDEINVSDEEIKEQTHKSLKRRIKSKKNNQSDLIDLMRKSISV